MAGTVRQRKILTTPSARRSGIKAQQKKREQQSHIILWRDAALPIFTDHRYFRQDILTDTRDFAEEVKCEQAARDAEPGRHRTAVFTHVQSLAARSLSPAPRCPCRQNMERRHEPGDGGGKGWISLFRGGRRSDAMEIRLGGVSTPRERFGLASVTNDVVSQLRLGAFEKQNFQNDSATNSRLPTQFNSITTFSQTRRRFVEPTPQTTPHRTYPNPSKRTK